MSDNSIQVGLEFEGHTHPLFQAIVRTLLYFDIFRYPLTKEEIIRFSGVLTEPDLVTEALEFMLEKKFIFRFGEFYLVHPNEELVKRRIKGNALAGDAVEMARRKSRFIGSFPFIRSVMASGSLSKGYMDENSDLDFFIVTEPGRLWLARMILVIYKRIFLFNSHKHFCINYFVSSDRLEIEEQNLFTATELATVIPMYGNTYYHELMWKNEWLKKYFPNYLPRVPMSERIHHPPLKKITEKILDLFGTRADQWCMRVTEERWKKIYQKDYSVQDFDVAFKSKKYASKNHPRNFQRKITVLLEENWQAFLKQFNMETV